MCSIHVPWSCEATSFGEHTMNKTFEAAVLLLRIASLPDETCHLGCRYEPFFQRPIFPSGGWSPCSDFFSNTWRLLLGASCTAESPTSLASKLFGLHEKICEIDTLTSLRAKHWVVTFASRTEAFDTRGLPAGSRNQRHLIFGRSWLVPSSKWHNHKRWKSGFVCFSNPEVPLYAKWHKMRPPSQVKLDVVVWIGNSRIWTEGYLQGTVALVEAPLYAAKS